MTTAEKHRRRELHKQEAARRAAIEQQRARDELEERRFQEWQFQRRQEELREEYRRGVKDTWMTLMFVVFPLGLLAVIGFIDGF